MTRRAALLLSAPLLGRQAPPAEPGEAPPDFVCPMDPDVRSRTPGLCPRCGMQLVAGIPEPVEYPVNLRLTPRAPKPAAPVALAFEVLDPRTQTRVRRFEVVHEKLFHLFVAGEDLAFFAHEHPVMGRDGWFRHTMVFPKPGGYRLAADFYPTGGTPQMHVRTLLLPGPRPPRPPLQPTAGPVLGENLAARLSSEPARPVAGTKTLLFFDLEPADGLEPYLGAWGHMLLASQDLIDLIHTHPFLADGGPRVQFNVIFPREGVHRLWVQFQRRGVVNTLAFNVPVTALR